MLPFFVCVCISVLQFVHLSFKSLLQFHLGIFLVEQSALNDSVPNTAQEKTNCCSSNSTEHDRT